MRSRAPYQFGPVLKPGPRAYVDNGLGKGLTAPNDLFRQTGETRVLDGVTIEFQMAPDTETPAEMRMFLTEFGVPNLAENAVHNFHSLLPFRGVQVRHALNRTTHISEAIALWGTRAEVLIGQHHWPAWDNARVLDYLQVQRDLYQYVHNRHRYFAPIMTRNGRPHVT